MKIRRCILWSCVLLLLCAGACAEDRIFFDPADLHSKARSTRWSGWGFSFFCQKIGRP